MPDLDARFDSLEHAMHSLAGMVGELVRENRALTQGLASDRAIFRETLRELSGFVATAGIALDRLERQVARLVEVTGAGFARMELSFQETQRLIAETSRETQRMIADNNRLIVDNNRLIAENNAVIRRLLDILARGRGNGEGPPGESGR